MARRWFYWRRSLVLWATLPLLLGGCAEFMLGGPDLPPSQNWSVRPEPVIPAGTFRAKALWNDPSVLSTKDGYVLYLTTSMGEPFQPPVLPFRATSADGQRWSLDPQEPLLQPDGGPYVSIETPSVVRFRGQWHMFFTGIYPAGGPAPMHIGHAVSRDGRAWTIRDWTFLTTKADTWRSYLVGEPGAVVVGDRLHVYFSASTGRPGGGPPLQVIGMVTSQDGRTFTSPRQVLGQGPVYPPSKGFAGYSAPAAMVRNGQVELYYTVAHWNESRDPSWLQVAIHRARSPDGLGRFVEDAQPIIKAEAGTHRAGEVIGPSVLSENGKVKMWFGAHAGRLGLVPLIIRGFKGPEFGIGYADIEARVLDAAASDVGSEGSP